jgi:DNA-binding response OmpR family regulator
MSQILLIEPDRLLGRTYEAAFKHAGHNVITARTAQQAIHDADNELPDAVILELQLAGHSGVEFLYEFRSYSDWQNIPIVIHTNVPYLEIEDGWYILNEHLGVLEYKYKPTTKLSSLVATVNQIIDSGE